VSLPNRQHPVIDAYSHVGLPRFQRLSDHVRALGDAGIDRFVLSAFSSSPDLTGLHAALVAQPDRLRVVGIPLGRDRGEVEASARAQLDAAFSGLRITDGDVLDRPWILDLLAERRALAVVAGPVAASDEVSARLLRHLDEHQAARVVAVHFAGVADPGVLDREPQAGLFAHSRFAVVFSRQGGYPAATVEPWAHALVDRFGWSRLLWGAEAPVLYWRDETLRSALAWVDRLDPTATEREDFFAGNAERLFFAEPPAVAPYVEVVDPWQTAEIIPATLWANGLPVDQDLAGRLVSAWNDQGGQASETLGAFVARLLDKEMTDDRR
jgi:predicted TIM-barrel fold metal-dependent hydrolase